MKTITQQLKLKAILLFSIIALFTLHNTNAQIDLRDCGFACTSNNFTIESVYLSSSDVPGTELTNTSCTPGIDVPVYMIMVFSSNQNAAVHHARIQADLSVGGTTLFINQELGQMPGSSSGPVERLIFGPFDWTCGTQLSLENILVVWKNTHNNPPDPINYKCHDYTNSQCQFAGDTVVSTPLAVQYDYTACTNESTATVNFESTTNGGTPPYTFLWDFDGGTLVGGTSSNPIVTYNINAGPYNPTLRVTDVNGNTNVYLYSELLVFPSELQNTTSYTDASCSISDASGSFTGSGGTPPYTFVVDSNTTGGSTFLNGPPSTVLSFTGAGPGTIQVTITDAAGCQKTSSITIELNDSEDPQITAPNDYTIEGCDTSFISDLVYSETSQTITLAQLQAALDGGGDASDDSAIDSISYVDTSIGTCSIVVTRTFTVTDACGKTGSDIQTITINDTTAPTFTVPADITIECDQNDKDLAITGDVTDEADNCSIGLEATYADNTTPGSCKDNFIITRTWTLVDDCGNTTTADQTITVVDTTAPTFTVPADITIECDQDDTDLSLTGDVSDEADNCSTGLEATYADSIADGACANESVITRTWTLVDDCGNTTTADQTITVVDTTAPTFTVPADITIECDQDDTDLSLTGDVSDEADNCSTGLEATYADSVADGACANESVITRTWTLVDDCGNTTTADQTINVVDTTAPTFTVPADITIECDQDDTDLSLTGDVSDEADNCSTGLQATYADSVAAGACANESVITRTWTLVDDCGNTTTADQTITVVDTTAPTFTVPADITIECDQDDTDLGLTGDVTDEADNCSTGLEATYADSVAAGACANESVITRTWTLVDDCGNTTTADQTITVVDTTAPVINIGASDLTVECDGSGNQTELNAWLASNGGATASDLCGSVTWSNDFVGLSDDCGETGMATVTFTATDACNNSDSTTAIFTIVDTTVPVIDTEAADLTVECDGTGNITDLNDWISSYGGAIASDDCSGIAWTNNFSGLSDDCGATGSATVTFTITDYCQNKTTTTATFTIIDTTAPTFTVPADITIECDQDETDLALTGDVTDEADNCSTGLEATYADSVAAGACANESVITRTWTLVDDCGNTTTADQTITVVDTTAPTFTVPADITIECDQDDTDLALTGDVTDEADNCSTGLEATYADSVAAGACANESVITRTWTLVDDCGNTTTADQTITVVDTTAPTFTVPADITIECDQDETDLALTGDVTDEADNCSTGLEATYADSVAAGACANESVITRTWTLVDDCGNTTTADQTITVVDTTAPTFTVPADITIECDQDETDLALTGDVTDEADNCSTGLEATYADSVAAGACANESVITRTWTLVDDCGNTTTADQTITVVDTTAPTFTVPADITIECDQDDTDLALTGDVTDEADNCSTGLEATYADSVAAGACANESVITRTWTLVDDCGNTTTADQTITVVDTTAPTFTVPADITIECDQDETDLALTGDVADEADNCSTGLEATYADSVAAGACANESVITRTWTLVDDCGNTTTADQTITVVDTTAPTFTVPADITIECDQDETDLALTGDVTDEADNCSTGLEATYADSVAAGACANESVITRTWTLVDDCGNTTTADQTITVVDTTAPIISTVAADQTVQCDGFGNTDELQLWLDTNAGAVAADNCGDVIWSNDFSGLSDGCGETGLALVTFTASDDCGNSTSTTALFTIIDLLPPTIDTEASDLSVECDGAGNTTDLNNWLNNNGGATSSDICGEITWTNDFSSLSDDCGATGSATVTFTVTDDCGNSSSTTATFTIVDTTAPTFTVPADITIECDQDDTDLALTGDVTDEADNCSTGLEATYADSVAAGACANESVITRTWTLVDDCGNTTTADQTITVVDTTAPVIDVPADDIMVECDGDGNGGAIQAWLDSYGGASASDNCGDVTWTNDYDGASSDCSAPVLVTFTATDACGNSSSTSATYAIQDTTAPTIDTEASDASVECDGAGNTTDLNDWLNNNGGAIATDDCSSITWSNDFSGLSDECGATGSATVTFTATDGCGNSSSTSATFTIVDTTAPTFTVPADITIECDQDDTDLALTGDVTDEADNCSTGLEATYADSVAAGACANESVITRTWTLVDDCGNTTTADQTITVVDTTAPTFTVPADITIECDQDDTDLALTGDVTDEADNCSTGLEATYADSVAAGACANESVITRTWTLVDDCGNTTTADQTITVVDTTAPTFTVPADITIECDQDDTDLSLTGDVSDEADNCSTGLEATYADSVAAGACANESVITRTWTLVDDCGNTTTADQTITVVDTTAPTFTVPADITIECDQDETDLALTGDVTDEADNCSTGLEATYADSVAAGACANESVITRTWTLVDDCGNTTTADQTITVVDTTAPTFTVPADITIECDQDETDLALTGDVTDEADNCSTGLEATYADSVAAGACANESVITRTWTLVDDCGNTTTADQTITVVDTTAPTFTVPADITIECDQDDTDLALTGDVTDEADNCSTGLEATYADSVAAGACANESVITRTWTLVDDCGNTTTADQTITVVDTTAPVIDVPADDIMVECDGDGNGGAIQAWLDSYGGASASDNCGDVTWTNDYDGASSDCSAPVLVTFTATDACGNSSSTSATYAIQDTTAPTIDTEASDASVECDGAGNTTDLNDWLNNNGGAIATDDCSSITWSNDFSGLSDECGATGSATVTFTATDGCGNSSSTSATFTIVDTTAPTFTVPADITIECDQDDTDLALTGDVTDEADNCSTGLEATYADSVAAGACANESVITRTWTLVDDCGNTTTADQTITVVDTTAPTFTVPADITIECDQDDTDLALTGDVTDEADNCSTGLEATYADSVAAGACANESVITRTWTLVDDCGNTTTADQTITVVDTTAPTFTVPADITIDCEQDDTDLALTGDVTDEADNCSTGLEATYADAVAQGECANESIITRTWTLVDDCGNTTTADQTITVVDTTAPTFTVPADITIECDQDETDLALTGDVTDEADNCSTDLDATFADAVAQGECVNESIITRTWTLIDDCGNTTTADQTITVADTTAPVFNELPEDATVECDNIPEPAEISATDNCSEVTISFEEEQGEGACDSDYVLTRTWTATDSCGNESVHIQIVMVQDTTAPVLIGELDNELDVLCDEIPEVPELEFEDACSENISVDFNETSTIDGTSDYEIMREWIVYDDCGNSSVYTQTLNVSPSSPITGNTMELCPEDLLVLNLFDYISGDYPLDGEWVVSEGNISLNGSEVDENTVFDDITESTYVFTYVITDPTCPSRTDVTFNIDPDCINLCIQADSIYISKAVTANGDQWNECFEVKIVDDQGNEFTRECEFTIEVQIFNRWGAKIYENFNYNDDCWNGFAHSNSVGSSGKVPTGTYYYIVNLKGSGLKPFAGPIYVGTK